MKPTNTTQLCEHEFVASIEEAGIEVCLWPGCTATREAPAGFDDAASVVVTVVEERAAA